MSWFSDLFSFGKTPARSFQEDAEAAAPQGTAQEAAADAPSWAAPKQVPDVFATITPAVPETEEIIRTSPLESARKRQRVSLAFDVSQPVSSRDALRGRDSKLTALLSGTLYGGNHAFIYGPRGSGKTSLARVFGDYADEEGAVVLYMASIGSITFSELMLPYIDQIPATCFDPRDRQLLDDAIEQARQNCNARNLVNYLAEIKYSRVIFILDEFDRIENMETRSEVASLLKLSSDARLPVSFLLVGIASDVPALIDAHPSLRRHVTPVSIEPLTDDEVRTILEHCASTSGLSFTQDAKTRIADLACGSPYHARLFGMHSACVALDDNVATVTPAAVLGGIEAAFKEWNEFNTDDADLFRQLADAEAGHPDSLAEFARKAAHRRGLDVSDIKELVMSEAASGSVRDLSTAAARLSSAITSEGDLVVFKDSLAPQFLLVALELTQARGKLPSYAREQA
jgi:Cdc6-like AAA superfamily ATPase